MRACPLHLAKRPTSLRAFVVVATLTVAAAAGAAPETRNGFVLEPSSIPVDEILAGGPPRDGIPALDAPATVTAGDAPWTDDERVIGVV